MAAYLERFGDPSQEAPNNIPLDKPQIKIGSDQQSDITVIWAKEQQGHMCINYQQDDDSYYLESRNCPIFLNGYPITGKVYLQDQDWIRLATLSYRFHEQEKIEETMPIGAQKCRIRMVEQEQDQQPVEINPFIEVESIESKPTAAHLENKLTKRITLPKFKRISNKTAEIPMQREKTTVAKEQREESTLGDTKSSAKPPASQTRKRRRTLQLQEIAMDSSNEAGMTLMMNIAPRAPKKRSFAELISPSNGQVLSLEKERLVVGRMSTCDLCLIDEYISREQLEFSKTSRGFLLKNIGKNEIIVEKKGFQSYSADKIVSEEKVLKPEESTFLTQEATIMLGSHILYYFNVDMHNMKTNSIEISILERKYKFHKHLAQQKQELLRAAQLQKMMTPPRSIFEDLQVGVWFRYFAIDDLSGDFFLTHKADNALFVCLGDVSGHGPAPALWASRISGLFDALTEEKNDLQEIVASINRHLIKKKNPRHTLYALVCLLKITENTAEFCIAGNSVPPLYYSAEEQKLYSLDTPSTPVGMMGPAHFKTYTHTLQFREKDKIIVFTDGVTEAELLDTGDQLEYEPAQKQIELQIQEQVKDEQFLDTFLSWLDHNSEIQDDLSITLVTRLDPNNIE